VAVLTAIDISRASSKSRCGTVSHGSEAAIPQFVFKLILHSLDEATPLEVISDEDDWHLMWIDSDDL
jgi:hypothetical protein